MNARTLIGLATAATIAPTAMASYNTALTAAAAPTYSTTLNFDEVGGPTGVVAPNSWAGIGLADMQAGDSTPFVGDNDTPNGGWGLGTGNSFYGAFGVFMTFSTDLDALSLQVWDPSGAPSPIGGGAVAFTYNDGVEVSNFAFEPAWGGLGDTWLNITADGGMVFDEVRILGFGFFPTTVVDNLSWNAVPTPASAALMGVAGLASARRRRR
ncbi:MAG: hypothetical protein H6812_13590 [Phycisphaeraceae bacterium]|nr:hypothetical protein [Phycisphaerales bacterium]MCA9311221.1 hypothetical protein [Phycisphaerales bacterium]MCB9844271.1 hypothetical protein [Phycisphaeraceae bacterium]